MTMPLPVYVSLTTISSRLDNLDRVLGAIINQKFKADKIILHVSIEPYMLDQGIRFEQLPQKTREWVNYGIVELYYCANIGSYRKILPLIERHSDKEYLIVTADDDVFYPSDWLEVLHNTCIKYDCVAAYRCRAISLEKGELKPYGTWPMVTPNTLRALGMDASSPSKLIVGTGRDGIMYKSAHLKDLAALRDLQKIAPGQDDIALKFLTLMAGVPVVRAPREATMHPSGLEFPGFATKTSLWASNSLGKNDEAVTAIARWCYEHRNFCIKDALISSRGDCSPPPPLVGTLTHRQAKMGLRPKPHQVPSAPSRDVPSPWTLSYKMGFQRPSAFGGSRAKPWPCLVCNQRVIAAPAMRCMRRMVRAVPGSRRVRSRVR